MRKFIQILNVLDAGYWIRRRWGRWILVSRDYMWCGVIRWIHLSTGFMDDLFAEGAFK